MSLNINFFCDERYRELVPEPIPSYRCFPKWFSQLEGKQKCPFSLGENKFQIGKSKQNIKGCPGIIDTLKFGYIIPSWSEFIFRETDDGKLYVNWIDNSGHQNTYYAHEDHQFHTMPNKPIYGHFGKIVSPWVIKTSPGVSCLITHPLWHRIKKFTSTTGIFHTDKSPLNVPWFFEWNYKIKSEMQVETMDIDNQVIGIGDPIIQIIPFYRKEYKSQVNYVSTKEISRLTNLQKTSTIDIVSKCPYNKFRRNLGKLFS